MANYYGTRGQYEPVEGKSIHWGGDRTSPPPDKPLCGFDGKGCIVEGNADVCDCGDAVKTITPRIRDTLRVI